MAVSNFTEKDLIEAIKKADIMLRPIILYVNPQDEELITKALEDVKEQIVIKPCNLVEAGKAYAFNRQDLDDYIQKGLYPTIGGLDNG